ncbi:universal stress protein [Streptomyces sp. NPDC002574]|uniref:universal stress protein n=1 Tax=Streptomyces sp. NPDC002574 TaxID=3364652 RepID=UPI00368C2B87
MGASPTGGMVNTRQDNRPRIVVGVDGSPSSKEALAWAVRQTSLVDGVIDAVIAWEYPHVVRVPQLPGRRLTARSPMAASRCLSDPHCSESDLSP